MWVQVNRSKLYSWTVIVLCNESNGVVRLQMIQALERVQKMLHVATGRWSYSLGGLCHVVSRKWLERAWREDIFVIIHYIVFYLWMFIWCAAVHIHIYIYRDVHENSMYVYIYIHIIISHLWYYTLYWDRPNSSLLVWLDLDTPQWFGHYSLVYIVYIKDYICIEMAKCCQRSLNLRVYRSS